MSVDGPPGARRWRWWGQPDETPPEPGEVLVYVDPDGVKPDWFHVVHHATRVRGRDPEHAWLVVTRHQLGADGSLPPEVPDGPWRHAVVGRPVPAVSARPVAAVAR